MNGAINKTGYLVIERVVGRKMMCCPFTDTPAMDPRPCGDWCPLFGEPHTRYEDDTNGDRRAKWTLVLCHKALTFDTFVDERTKC